MIRVVGWVFCFFILQENLFAHNESNSGVKESEWKGFKRLDFSMGDKNAWLIASDKALAGNPWIWRARFPGWHTDADSILVSEGFYLVYINTDNLYGSPRAVKAWDHMEHLRSTSLQCGENRRLEINLSLCRLEIRII